MDEQITRLTTQADPVQKWRTARRTQTKRLRGDKGEWLPTGFTFYGEWIVLGWVKNFDQPRWVKVADCERIESVEPPPVTPETGEALIWLKSDYELANTKYKRKRPNIAGYPHTVRMSCVGNGVLPASDDYIHLVLELNPSMTMQGFMGMMDSWNAGNKWRDGNSKVPVELIFACNTYGVRSRLRNKGGLTGIPVGAWIVEIDTLPYEALGNYTAETLPAKYVMHLTLAKQGRNNVDPSPAMGGRILPPYQPTRLPVTSASPMYILEAVTKSANSFKNPYTPAWEW